MKNTFDGLISRLDRAEERISVFEDISIEISKNENKAKRKDLGWGRGTENIQELWDNYKTWNVRIIPEERGKQEEIFETMTKNFPKLM